MKTYILTILFLLHVLLSAQQRVFPNLPTDNINDMYFISADEVIFVNAGGSIYKSYDGGETWSLKKYLQGESLLKIDFINQNIGFVLPAKKTNAGSIGVVYTTDRGENWSVQSIQTSDASDFLPISETISLKSTRYSGSILRLDNFYNSWDTVYQTKQFELYDSEFGAITYDYGYVKRLSFLPNRKIIALGTSEDAYHHNIISDSVSFLLESNDLGLSWDTLWTDFSFGIEHIAFTDSIVGWMSYNKNLYKTENGGTTWNLIREFEHYINGLSSLGQEFLIVSTSNSIQATNDGGITFNEIYDNNKYFYYLYKATFLTPDIGFLYNRNILKTTNSGNDWEPIIDYEDDDIHDISFGSPLLGFAAGQFGFYKSTDGGYSWTNIKIKVDTTIIHEKVKNVVSLNEQTAFVIQYDETYYEKIYSTHNSGLSWEKTNLPNNQVYSSIHFYDDSFGFINTAAEEVSRRVFDTVGHYFTTDGGETWTLVPDTLKSQTAYFEDVQILSPDRIFALNRYGLWLTKDTAKTWISLYSQDGGLYGYRFAFTDDSLGIISSSNWLLTTTDGGNSWKENLKSDRNPPKDFVYLGKDYWGDHSFIECGEGGKIFQYDISEKGSITSSRQKSSGTNQSINKISLYRESNRQYGWFAGSGFTILYRDYQYEYTDVEEESLKNEFHLSQNYPNPFNPATTIKFYLPVAAHVTIKIYDALGREIKTLLDKKFMISGSYETIFNGESFSSGVYFYQIIVDDFVNTKKMVLIK